MYCGFPTTLLTSAYLHGPTSVDHMIIIIIIIIIIITTTTTTTTTYLTRVNPSAEAVINGCPGQLKD